MDKRNFRFIELVLFLIIGGVMGYFAFNDKNQGSTSDTIIRIDSVTKVDTIKIVDTITLKAYIPTYITIYDTTWLDSDVDIDTNKIIIDFFNKNIYIDTIVNDSNLLVIVIDTISQNKILNRKPFIINNYQHIITEKTKNIYMIPNNQYYIGVYAGTVGVGGEFMYQRKLNVFGVGGGTNGIYFKYARRLKKR